jgi:DNA processing protein
MTDPKAYWAGLNLVKGIGAVRMRALLDTFGDPETAWKASYDSLCSAGLPVRVAGQLIKIRHEVDLDRYWERVQQCNVEVLTWDDDGYPRRLKEIDQPPPLLYVRGSIQLEDDWAVAIVGTRRVSPYGRQVAEEVAGFLAGNGVTVVSGLARGVDTAAHDAALKAGGRTIAVLGSGVDRIYPDENRRLSDRIIQKGAVISDYPMGTAPESANFPPRNRIISGLSLAVVVVEAGETSGALITASFAANQGREVFAVPGGIHAPQSKGTNSLIQQGARPLLRVEEILEVLSLQMVQEQQVARAVLPVDETEARLLNVIGRQPIHIDEIQIQSGLPIEQVSATLAMMELKGMVRQLGGMNYAVVRELSGDYRIDENE